MAFIASKYTGGIDVNQVDRLAPLFSGGGTATAPDVDFIPVSGATTASSQFNQIGYDLAFRHAAALRDVANGVPGAMEELYAVGQAINQNEIRRNAVEYTNVNREEIKKSDYGDMLYAGDIIGGTLDLVTEMFNKNPNADLYANYSTMHDRAYMNLESSPLINPDGTAISFRVDAILKEGYEGINEFTKKFLQEVSGYTIISRGGGAPGDKPETENYVFSNDERNSENYVHLLNGQKQYVQDIVNNEGMYSEARSLTLSTLISNYNKGQGFTFPTAIKSDANTNVLDRRFSDSYNLLEATNNKTKDIIQVAEVYTSGESLPRYYPMSVDSEGKTSYGNPIKNLNEYSFQYMREEIFNPALESFATTYAQIDENSIRDYEGTSELLHNLLHNADKTFADKYGRFKKKEDYTTEKEYEKDREILYKYAKQLFHGLLDNATEAYLRKSYENKIDINKKIEITTRSDIKDRTGKGGDGTDYYFDRLVDQLSNQGRLNEIIQIGYDANHDGFTTTVNIDPTSQEMVHDPILVAALNKNNDKGALGFSQGMFNPNPGLNSDLRDNFSSFDNWMYLSTGSGERYAIPFDAQNAKGHIVNYGGEVILTNILKNFNWQQDDTTEGDPSQTSLSGKDISASITPYRGYQIAMSVSDFLDIQINISKEEYVEIAKTLRGDRKIKVGYTINGKVRSHSEDVSEITDQEKALQGIKNTIFFHYRSDTETRIDMRNTYIDNWSYVNRTAMITEAGNIYKKHGISQNVTYENLSPAVKEDMDILHQKYLKRYNDAVDEQIANNLNTEFEENKDDGRMYARIRLGDLYDREKDVIAHMGYNAETNPRGIQVIDITQSCTGSNYGTSAKLLTKVDPFWSKNKKNYYVVLDMFNHIPLSKFSDDAKGKMKETFNKLVNTDKTDKSNKATPVL